MLDYGFYQSWDHSGYFWFVFFFLSHYCSSYPNVRIRSRLGKKTIALEFQTRSMPCITELHSFFYINKVKIIPQNIYDLLTSVALAHWIMGDGVNDHGFGIILCTDSYTVQDVIRLINVLIIRYRLDCRLRKHTTTNFRIYIKQGSMPLLRTIVSPFFHHSMLYKLGK